MAMLAARTGLTLILLLLGGTAAAQETDLVVGKTGPAVAAAGSDVAYVVTLDNLGPDAGSNVVLNDPVPAGMTFVSATQNAGPAFSCATPAVGGTGPITCSTGSFAAGASASFVFTLQIPPGTPPSTFFTNIVTVANDVPDVNPKSDSAVAVTQTPSAPQADLAIGKSAPSAAAADGDITYTLTLGNLGPDGATNVGLMDTLPGDLSFVSFTQNSGPAFSCATPAVGAGGTVTCTRSDLAPGNATFTLVAHVPAGTPSGTTYTNSAFVTSDADPNSENDAATASTTVAAADLSIVKTGAAGVTGGQDLSYTVTLASAGPDTDTDVQWLDTLPPQTTFVSLTQNSGPAFVCFTPGAGAGGQVGCSTPVFGSGASASFTLVVRVSALHAGGVLSNTAQVDGSSFDPDPSDDSSTATTVVTPATTDLAASKSAPATVLAGQTLSYTLGIANVSANPALAPTLADVLPAGVAFVSFAQTAGPAFACSTPPVGGSGSVACNAAVLAAGASAQFTLVVSVPAGTAHGTSIANTASVAAGNPDGAAGNDSASASTQVINQADLSVSKTGPAAGIAGGNLAYTITVANGGPLPANAVQLSDALPAGTRFVSLQQTAGPLFACSTPAPGATGTVACTLATLPVGSAASFNLTLAVDPTVPANSVITNTATATSATSDPGAANNSASSATTISNFVDLSASKSGPASVVVGSPIAYELAVTNAGTSPALDVQLSDPLPAGTTFASLVQTAGPAFACTTPAVGANGTVTCTLASLAAGTTARFTLSVAATPTPATITNTVTVSSSSTEAGMANNAASQATQVGAGGALPAVTVPTLQFWSLLALALLLALGARTTRD